MNRVLVVGGGVVGASAAWHLAREGVDVVLIDRHDQGHATAAGAGIISPATSLRPLPAFYALGSLASREYPSMIQRLSEDGQCDTQFAVVGKLFVAHTDDERARLDDILGLFRQRNAEGMPGLDGLAMIDAKAAQAMFPPLGPLSAAIHVPGAARVDGGHLRDALVAAASRHGATVVNGSAIVSAPAGGDVAVSVDDDRYEGDRLILAGGAWTNALLEGYGLQLALEPQRGQIVHLAVPGADTSGWPILAGFHDQYVVTFGPNRVVVGATRETGSGYSPVMTMDGLQSVFEHALGVAPGLGGCPISDIRVGLRPLSVDGLPFIGQVPGNERVIVATGHGPSGLQLGPYSGGIAAALATGRSVEADLAPFAIDRVLGNASKEH